MQINSLILSKVLIYESCIIRHGQSLWNLENKFTGWVDIDLSERGEVEAKTAGVTLIDNNFYPEICFTSYLKRSINTAAHIIENYKKMNITFENVKKWELNERHYGALQGLDKIETAKKYGQEQVQIWRRSFDTSPPWQRKIQNMIQKLMNYIMILNQSFH